MLKNIILYLFRVKDLFVYYTVGGIGSFLHVSIRFITAPLEKIIDFIPKEAAAVLDFGCGHGLFEVLLMRRRNNLRVIGSDIDSAKIETARKLNLSDAVEFKTAVEVLPTERFDAVLMLDVIYLLPFEKQIELFRHMYSVLTPNGRLILKTQNPSRKIKYLIDFLQETISVKLLKITDTTEKTGRFNFIFPVHELLLHLQSAGFKTHFVDVSRGFLHPHCLVIADKHSPVAAEPGFSTRTGDDLWKE
jgi:2-polyprenyl-3-methyl-5-hydroxy-6-metoxy-1,4-benzoquinol methylase